MDGCVVPVLTTDNIERTHPWTSCDIWEHTDTGDRETDRGHWHSKQVDHTQTQTNLDGKLTNRDTDVHHTHTVAVFL